MWRALTALILGTVVCTGTVMSAAADDQKAVIKNGIEGKVTGVDVDGKTLTISTPQGRQRTFSITDDTTMVGPRGGKVRRRLKDPRFREGVSVTVVADGNSATEVHLGFLHPGESEKAAASGTANDRDATATPAPTRAIPAPAARRVTRSAPAATPAEEDDENEVPGKIKRFDSGRRILVVTLLNGKDRAFMLPKDLKVLVKGSASQQGLEDPALKVGAPVEVVTDEGGHKVRELKVVALPSRRR